MNARLKIEGKMHQLRPKHVWQLDSTFFYVFSQIIMHLGVFKFVSKPCCAINYNTIQFKSRPNAKKQKFTSCWTRMGKQMDPSLMQAKTSKRALLLLVSHVIYFSFTSSVGILCYYIAHLTYPNTFLSKKRSLCHLSFRHLLVVIV